jgi:hypothetical protein
LVVGGRALLREALAFVAESAEELVQSFNLDAVLRDAGKQTQQYRVLLHQSDALDFQAAAEALGELGFR